MILLDMEGEMQAGNRWTTTKCSKLGYATVENDVPGEIMSSTPNLYSLYSVCVAQTSVAFLFSLFSFYSFIEEKRWLVARSMCCHDPHCLYHPINV